MRAGPSAGFTLALHEHNHPSHARLAIAGDWYESVSNCTSGSGDSKRPCVRSRNCQRREPDIGARDLRRFLRRDFRAFEVTQIAAQLLEIVVLVNWPRPFSATARDLVDACIEARVHYVDRR